MSRAAAPSRRLVAGVAMGAVLLASADTYVVVLALPSIMASLGIGLDQLQQATPIVSGFLLGYVAVMPLIGRLSDMYGRRPLLLGCLAVFAAGSLITASAASLAEAVAGRALQGLGGGGLVPLTLALIADRWSPEERGLPLGFAGAVQEFGSVAGPLYGALILAVSGWRTIFWVNLPLAALAGALLLLVWPAKRQARPRPRLPLALAAAGVVAGALAVAAPPLLVEDATWGNLYVPLLGAGWLTPLSVVAIVCFGGALVAAAHGSGAARSLRAAAAAADWPGGLLVALALALLVVTFAGADPSRQVLSGVAPALLACAAASLLLLVLRERRALRPLVPGSEFKSGAALGALIANLALGAALMAALVNIPILARSTVFPDSQLDAALVLLRLLVAVPVGAAIGGRLLARVAPAAVAAAGLALAAAAFCLMATWSATTLADPFGPSWLHPSDPVLVAGGFGFGLAIAPLNASLLDAVRPQVHGLASSLLVVARMIGMVAGISILTAIGLRAFYARAATLPTPITLCPASPLHCSAYDSLVTGAIVGELHAVFVGAAGCAAFAALVSAATLRGPRSASSMIPAGV